MRTDEPDLPEARRRKAHLLAAELGLSRAERLELAEYLLRRDVPSWKGLADAQVCRLLDALEGAQLIEAMRMQRSRL